MKKSCFRCLVAMLWCVGIAGCGSNESLSVNEIPTWISAFTSEMVSPDEVIRIVASDSLFRSLDGDPSLKGVFHFNPSVKGIARYREQGRVLEFVPDSGALKPGEAYQCRLSLSRLTGDRLRKDFSFSFVVGPESKPKSQAEMSTRADATDPEFRLLSAERCEEAEPYLYLVFSAPLSPEQELAGLIAIQEVDEIRIERKGAQVKVFYPNNGLEDLVLCVSDRVRSEDGRTLVSEIEQHFAQSPIPPAIEIPLSGSILPDGSRLLLPFRSVNLAAVDVEVVKIYSSNILTFLQDHELHESYKMRRVGRLIHRQTVRLDTDESVDLHRWQQFSIDLKNLFRQEPGAMYNIRLTFRQAYSLYNRQKVDDLPDEAGLTAEDRDAWDLNEDYIWRQAPDHDPEEYEWLETDDPTKKSYYMLPSRMPEYNLMASNLGLVVKRGEGDRLWCSVSDLMTARPVVGAKVTAYNYQMQPIGSGRTDKQGFVDFEAQGRPFVVTATDGNSTTYLKTNAAHELSTSRFDVGGKKSVQGIKGFVYGERGVWRPGDEIFLTLIVEDEEKSLPKHHPVSMELYTPTGQLYDEQTLTQGLDGIYVFTTRTDEEAPTGSWEARFRVGGQTFRKAVRVETITPNRLKVAIQSADVLQAGETARFGLESQWLTGTVAKGLSAKLEVEWLPGVCDFVGFESYTFQNPIRPPVELNRTLFEGRLDSLGKAVCAWKMPAQSQAPGMLYANLVAQVFEAGGDASMTSRMVRYSPFESYVGIRLGEKEFETDRDLLFPVVTVDASGMLIERELRYKVYKLNWNWWWEGSAQELNRYVQGTSRELVASGTLHTHAGKADLSFRVDYPSWGKYLIWVEDPASGHAAGGVIYLDWPEWRGHSGKQDPTAATLLSFALDQPSYQAGDYATVFLPKAGNGRVLLSIEQGDRVLSRRWIETKPEEETAYRFLVTREMAPNFYVHATLLQPHAQTANDLPIRMYGVEGAKVVDPMSVLEPVIEAPEEVLPQESFCIRVREQQGRPMSYTLALVDEGLLDITAFRTPQPWIAMNQREALGVKTWDMYADVIGAFGGQFSAALRIGGDEALRRAAGKEKRFHPVVQFLGPFTLSGGCNTHRITLPKYEGSVRVMVVAAKDGAYGSTDRTLTVRAPLMALATLPRQLSCGEKVQLPVNLFVSDTRIQEVEVFVQTEGPLTVEGPCSKKVKVQEDSEPLLSFELCTAEARTGTAKVILSANSGEFGVTDTISIQVKNPLPDVISSESLILGGGETHRFEVSAFRDGTAELTLSPSPMLDFSGAFAFVENYPHRCSEQLAARALFLLYARQYLHDSEQKRAESVLQDILKTLASRQLGSGGFVYWPGNDRVHDWVTSMAGEVFYEARRQGFRVPDQLLEQWETYQKSAARSYRHSVASGADLVQAYRIYTLVLVGEQPIAAMNRLRESKQLSHPALLRLAAAYAVMGRGDVAMDLVNRLDTLPEVRQSYETFGSSLRDQAMALETWVWMGDKGRAFDQAAQVAERFAPGRCSTQEVAFVSVAMNRFLAGITGMEEGSSQDPNIGATIAMVEASGSRRTFQHVQSMQSWAVSPQRGWIEVKNVGQADCGVALSLRRTPAPDDSLEPVSEGVDLTVRYSDLSGRSIEVDSLQQGQEFRVQIEVHGCRQDRSSMALTYAVPSGWEIWNSRLVADGSGNDARQDTRHQEIRDDRVQWYFPIKKGERHRFEVRLRAAYAGDFVLPPAVCEDMYDAACRAVTCPSETVVMSGGY